MRRCTYWLYTLASVENIRDPNGTPATISKYAYVNDAAGRRTSMVMTGAAFSGSGGDHHWRWGYNDRSELTAADRCEDDDLQTACSPMTPDTYTYAYDPIGNREQAGRNAASTYYCVNELNQYTFTDDASGTCPTPSTPTEAFTYDADGNLTEDARFTYTWDGENRLIGVEPASSPVNGDMKRLSTTT